VPLVMGVAAAAMLLTYNAVAYRELVRQGQGGEVLKVRWWFARGAVMKDLYGDRPGARRLLLAIGRRDFFVLAWVIMAALGLLRLVLAYAVVIAAVSFVVAVGQILSRRSAGAAKSAGPARH